MSLTTIISRIGWQMAASNPIVGPYVIAAQRADVQYAREVTQALDSDVVYSRETGSRLDVKLSEMVPQDWTSTC